MTTRLVWVYALPLLSRAVLLQGVDGWDVDLPTMLEANWITSFVAKVLWVFVYIAVYGLRPVIIRPKPIGETPAVLHGIPCDFADPHRAILCLPLTCGRPKYLQPATPTPGREGMLMHVCNDDVWWTFQCLSASGLLLCRHGGCGVFEHGARL